MESLRRLLLGIHLIFIHPWPARGICEFLAFGCSQQLLYSRWNFANTAECEKHFFPCSDSSRACIHQSMYCNGIRDCPDGEDENPYNCKKNKMTGHLGGISRQNPDLGDVEENYFDCCETPLL
ncbi:unnamed protein product [Darwinula stevensoni]|uniref:Uncharacterized protein n=1 Tax=Darwinula stevensoni TaxID=69355 RepID=A0A7R9A0B3_9CRUS|nr:unnamed protein product [Darwinula stevensoni]CAG0880695.1 unnamed protein product [Darwinula stevensoni]